MAEQVALTAEELAQWGEVTQQATAGPWAWDSRGDKCSDVQVGIAVGKDDLQVGGFIAEGADVVYIEPIATVTSDAANADGDFIALAREAMPRLLAEVKRLQVAPGQQATIRRLERQLAEANENAVKAWAEVERLRAVAEIAKVVKHG